MFTGREPNNHLEEMSFNQSQQLLENAVKSSYLNFDETIADRANNKIEVRATDPITGAAANVYGYLDNGGDIKSVIYQNWGRPFETGDVSKFVTTIRVNTDNAGLFFDEVKDYLSSPILLDRGNAQGFTNALASLDGVTKRPNGADVAVSINGGGIGNTFFEPIFSAGITDWTGSDRSELRRGNQFYAVEETFYGRGGNDQLFGYSGSDRIFGETGDDYIHGMHGGDRLFGGAGNDTIRGGHGHDVIDGGLGRDWIWGGTGKNTVDAGRSDNSLDQIFVPVDSVQNQNGNPNGVNADLLENLGGEDRIFLHGSGISDSVLTFGSTSYNDEQGIGIYANGTLEALVTGGFSAGQVDAMTTGGFFA